MAIKRPPPHSTESKNLDPVRIDRQDLRDIYGILEALPLAYTSSRGTTPRIRVNEYDADTMDDVFEFDRTVESVSLSTADLRLTLSLHSEVLSMIVWDNSDQAVNNAVREIEKILNPRFVKWDWKERTSPVEFLSVFFVLVVVIGGAYLGFREIDATRENALSYAITLQIVVAVAISAFKISRPHKHRVKVPVSIFIEAAPKTDEPWWRRHDVELMLVLTAIAAFGTVLALIV